MLCTIKICGKNSLSLQLSLLMQSFCCNFARENVDYNYAVNEKSVKVQINNY